MVKYQLTQRAAESADLCHLTAHLPELFDARGDVIHSGRNCIKTVAVGSLSHLGISQVVIKQHFHANIFQRFDYSYIRHSKARRAYDYAHTMLQRGIGTPEPLAYAEEWRHGLYRRSFYVCAQAQGYLLKERIYDDPELRKAFARFIARMHEAGIVHGDLNPSNTICSADDSCPEGIRFMLVDVNRAKIHRGPVPVGKCRKDYVTLSLEDETYRLFVREYLEARNLYTPETEQHIVQLKYQFDHRPRRLKRLFKPYKEWYYRMIERNKK